MNRLDTTMKISGIDFNFTTEVEIESSYEMLTDIVRVVVPKKLIFKKDGQIVENITKGENAIFKRGDFASIDCGYDGDLSRRFTGVISSIKTKYPLEFTFEDDYYKLKHNILEKISLEKTTLSDLISKIIPKDIKRVIHIEQNLGQWRIDKGANSAQVMDELRSKHGVYSFFRDGVLHIGLSSVPSLQSVVRFTMFKNIIDSDSLVYVEDEDRPIKIVCKSIDNDNKTLEASAGDPKGETRTFYFNNITLKDLQGIADRYAREYRYSGYEGTFTTFISPKVQHGDIVEIINPQIPEQSGGYLVNKVVTSSGMSGGRQTISIKRKFYDLELSGSSYIKTNLTPDKNG